MSKYHTGRPVWQVVGLLAGSLCVAEAMAQTTDTSQTQPQPKPAASTHAAFSGLEEVIVTAQRRAERVQDVPISLSALNQDKLDKQGLRSIDDVTLFTPGVVFQRMGLSGASNYNDQNSDISIRGIQSNAGASTTAIYLDDTPIQTRHIGFGTVNAFPALFDLERVEVLRGPQGTLFGAGSEGGAVRFVTPDPSVNHYSSYTRAELADTEGGDTSYEAGVAGGGPIIQDKLGFRASAYFRRDGGYVDRADYRTNQVTEKNSNWQNTANLRLALKWRVTDNVAITPSIYYQKLFLADTAAFWPELSDGANGVFHNGNAQHSTSTDPFYLATVKLDWDFGSTHLTTNTSYFSRRQHSLPDYTQFDRTVYGLPGRAPYGHVGESPFEDTQDNTIVEARLQSTDSNARLTWTAGFFFARLDENELQKIVDPTLDSEYTALYGTPLCTTIVPCPGGVITTQPEYRLIDRQTALYGEMNVKITQKWSVTAGARLARNEFEGETTQYGAFTGPTNNVNNPLTGSGSGTATPVTPRLVLNYRPTSDNLFYASAAKGYRVGGINQGFGPLCNGSEAALGLTGGAPPTYRADSLWSYELGAKNSLLDHRLQINTSVYQIDWKGIQQNIYLLACGLQYVANLGTAESHGGDIDVQYKPNADLLLDFTAAYTDAKYTNTVCGGPVDCTVPGSSVMPIVTKGDRLPGSPWTFTLSGEYTLPYVAGREPYVRVDYRYATRQTAPIPVQDTNNGAADPINVSLPVVKLLAVRTGLRWNGMDVSLYGENLTNEHPLLFQTRDTVASDLIFQRSERPRTIGLTATYHY